MQFLGAAPATAGLRLRGTNGAADDTSRATLTLGDRNNTGGGNTDGEMLLNGHPVDIKVGTLIIGQDRSGSTSATHGGVGVLQFDTGTVDATNIIMANCTTADATTPSATGTLTVGTNGKLIAGNGGISLANQVHGTATGNLNIFGTAVCSNSIVKVINNGTGANITITGGALTMTAGTIGTPAAPVDNLNLTTATMTLPVLNNSTNIILVNFNPVDTASIINISSLPILSGYPSQFPLATYSSLLGGGSISLGTLPGTFQGYITNDTSVNTVFLVVTNGPTTSKLDQWSGGVNSAWDTTTPNWTNAGLAVAYAENDSVAFDDTAQTGAVNYSTTHTPLNMTFTDDVLNYVFGGTGKISGSSGLVKSGVASLTLSASGGDNFSGGITVNGGTVILDNANSAISGPLVVSSGATFQVGNNDANGNVPSASIASDGTLVFNRANNLALNTPISGAGSLEKIGNGILTLSNASPYTGDTLAFKGTLALAGTGAISSSGNVVVSNATFDVSAVASGVTTLNNLSISNSVLTLGSSNVQAPLNVTSLTMGGSGNTINLAALPTVATYPDTITLVQSSGGISGFNATMGTFPSASPPYAGTIALSADQTAILLTLTAGPTGTRASVLWTGNDAPNLNTNWSDGLNWQLPGAPGASDNVIFNSTDTVSDAVTINNIVDANTTISTLRFTNAAASQWHVTGIPTGVTLNVSSNVTIGGLSQDGATTLSAVTGGGSLVVGGTTMNIGNNGSGSIDSGTTWDLSALNSFVYAVPTGTFAIGIGNRSVANFKMANGSNYITATNFNDNIAASSSSGTRNLSLGRGTNVYNVANFNAAAGRANSTISFPDGTGGLRIRGLNGTDTARATLTLGNRNNGGGSGNNCTGTLSLNGHPVDLKLSSLTMGESGSNPTGSATGTGTISYDTGTIDVTSIIMAVSTGTTVGVQANGTINLGANGTLVVGSGGVNLGNRTGVSGAATGTLNIGGTVISSGSIIKSTNSATANITVTNGGTIKMLSGVIGNPAAPIDSLTLDTATLQLNVNGNSVVTNIVATTVAATDTTTINIGSVANVTAPATFSLISYTGTDPFPNLVLGTLPSGVTATLVDNAANATIDLNITAVAPSIPPTIQKITISGGNVIISGTNNAGAGGTFHVLASTNLTVPLTNWTVLTNGTFDSSGNFSSTNAIDTTKPRGFYILQVP